MKRAAGPFRSPRPPSSSRERQIRHTAHSTVRFGRRSLAAEVPRLPMFSKRCEVEHFSGRHVQCLRASHALIICMCRPLHNDLVSPLFIDPPLRLRVARGPQEPKGGFARWHTPMYRGIYNYIENCFSVNVPRVLVRVKSVRADQISDIIPRRLWPAGP